MLLYRYDDEGFFTNDIYEDNYAQKKSGNYTKVALTSGFYKPKFDGLHWVEGATTEEIEELKTQAIALEEKLKEENHYTRLAKIEQDIKKISETLGLNL